MHALGEFIQQQMTARGWKQAHLVRASGLTKQVVWALLSGNELVRMVAPETVRGLATAFAVADDLTEEEQAEALHSYEQVVLLKSAQAIGVPVNEPVVVTVPREPSDEELIEFLRRRLLERRQPVAAVDTSEAVSAPNSGKVDKGADDEVTVSGEIGTSGDLRAPRRQSRGSDETDGGEQARAEQQHSNRPQL